MEADSEATVLPNKPQSHASSSSNVRMRTRQKKYSTFGGPVYC